MNDLHVLVALAVAVFACLYAEWSLDRPVPRRRIGAGECVESWR